MNTNKQQAQRTFGRLRAIASSKDGLAVMVISSKQTEWKAKRKKLTHCKADGFYRIYRPDRKQQQSSV